MCSDNNEKSINYSFTFWTIFLKIDFNLSLLTWFTNSSSSAPSSLWVINFNTKKIVFERSYFLLKKSILLCFLIINSPLFWTPSMWYQIPRMFTSSYEIMIFLSSKVLIVNPNAWILFNFLTNFNIILTLFYRSVFSSLLFLFLDEFSDH